MADDSGDAFWRPLPLALSAVAIIGWLLAAYLWTQASQVQSQMTELLRAAEKSRELLAADLQNLQKAAGTAAELKTRAAEAEKALSEAASSRASAQNELTDLTKQINDAKLAISGAQEEASARSRDLQAVDGRLKDETDRLTQMQSQEQSLSNQQTQAQSQLDGVRAALAEAQNQTASAQREFETIQGQINSATAELNALQEQIHSARANTPVSPPPP